MNFAFIYVSDFCSSHSRFSMLAKESRFSARLPKEKNNRESISRRETVCWPRRNNPSPIASGLFQIAIQVANVFSTGIEGVEHAGADSVAEDTVAKEGEGGGDARGGCNLYYPSTISVERIGGARITVITTDTRNNIMRDASRVYLRSAAISPLNEL